MGNEANPLPSAIALSMALAEIDTELWEQNDTIDRAAKTIVEQWGLMADLANALGRTVELLQQQGWTGATLERSKVALEKAREALS